MGPARLLPPPRLARRPGGGHRPARADHAVPRAQRELRTAREDRPLDAAALTLRLRDGRGRLLDALPPLNRRRPRRPPPAAVRTALSLLHEVAAHHRDGLAAELDAIAHDADADDAPAGGGLVGEELRLAEPRAPEGAERAVGRARHRVLRDARARREEARDEVVFARRGAAPEGQPPHPEHRHPP